MVLTPKRRPSRDELFAHAIARIKSYPTRPSTVGAELFLNSSPSTDYKITPFKSKEQQLIIEWKSLPFRLRRLMNHLKTTVHNQISNISTDQYASNLELETRKKDIFEKTRLSLTAAIFVSAPQTLLPSFKTLFATILSIKSKEDDMEESIDSDNDCLSMNSNHKLDFDEDELYYSLRYLGWIPKKLNAPLCEALHETIMRHISKQISGEFEENSFESIMSWKQDIIIPWLQHLFDNQNTHFFEEGEWDTKIDFAVSQSFCHVRIKEIFDIVAEFPDSMPAVEELKLALLKTQMHDKLKKQLKISLEKRLIHPGANTSQIIDVYINTIKVLRVIDPSDGLLEDVAPPVRSYLRSRNDTVRCIVTSLTSEEEGGDLYQELRRQDAKPVETQLDSDDEDEKPDPNWMPASKQSNQTSSGGTGDILSMLVGIYGSKELFVNEYRLMLADKLLAILDFNTNREVHNLELLKLRFGEVSMRQCEVMIKDIDDSRRIIANIHSTLKNKALHKANKDAKKNKDSNPPESISSIPTPFLDAAIISHIFWPALQKDSLTIHPKIQFHLDQFSKEYAKLKNPRRLEWFPQIGTVELELDLEEIGPDGETQTIKKEFTCSPIQATLISHFESKNIWTITDLAEEIERTEEFVTQKMSFWTNHKVVEFKVTNNVKTYELSKLQYQNIDNDDYNETGDVHIEEDDGDGSDQAVAVGVQDEEAMQVYGSFVIGMLSNLGKLPLDRIHNLLKMFVASSEHKYNKTPQELNVFLQQLVKEDKLECGVDGLYGLVKKS